MRISRGQRQVEMLHDWHAWKKGDVVELDGGVADALVWARHAVDHVPTPKTRSKRERAMTGPEETRAATPPPPPPPPPPPKTSIPKKPEENE